MTMSVSDAQRGTTAAMLLHNSTRRSHRGGHTPILTHTHASHDFWQAQRARANQILSTGQSAKRELKWRVQGARTRL